MNTKTYTLIDFFSIGDGEPDECWVANYANREDALKAFKFKIHEAEKNCGSGTLIDEEERVVVDSRGNKMTLDELFDDLLSNGECYESVAGSCRDKWFVRGEDVQRSFDESVIATN